MAKKKSKSRQSVAAKPLKFDKRLVLNQWLLNLFEVPNFEKLAEDLKNRILAGTFEITEMTCQFGP